MDDPLNRVATAIGAGLLAGAAGKARFPNVVHWGYGTGTTAGFSAFR